MDKSCLIYRSGPGFHNILIYFRVIYLRCCLGVSRTGSTKRGHTVALYAKAQTMVLVAEDEWEQEEWYQAVRKLMEEERREEGFTEEDDGYSTLPPAAFFKEVGPRCRLCHFSLTRSRVFFFVVFPLMLCLNLHVPPLS